MDRPFHKLRQFTVLRLIMRKRLANSDRTPVAEVIALANDPANLGLSKALIPCDLSFPPNQGELLSDDELRTQHSRLRHRLGR
jgi:hypothetical protein